MHYYTYVYLLVLCSHTSSSFRIYPSTYFVASFRLYQISVLNQSPVRFSDSLPIRRSRQERAHGRIINSTDTLILAGLFLDALRRKGMNSQNHREKKNAASVSTETLHPIASCAYLVWIPMTIISIKNHRTKKRVFLLFFILITRHTFFVIDFLMKEHSKNK